MRVINREKNQTLVVFDVAGIHQPSKAILFSFGMPVVIVDHLRKEIVYLRKRHKARTRNISRHVREELQALPTAYKSEPVDLQHLRGIVGSLYQSMVGSILPHAKESDSITIREFKKKKGSLLNIL